MNLKLIPPSIYAHIINGLLLVVVFVLLYKNYSKIRNLEPYKLIMLTSILSISIGIHSLSHLGLESVYDFNPISAIYM